MKKWLICESPRLWTTPFSKQRTLRPSFIQKEANKWSYSFLLRCIYAAGRRMIRFWGKGILQSPRAHRLCMSNKVCRQIILFRSKRSTATAVQEGFHKVLARRLKYILKVENDLEAQLYRSTLGNPRPGRSFLWFSRAKVQLQKCVAYFRQAYVKYPAHDSHHHRSDNRSLGITQR